MDNATPICIYMKYYMDNATPIYIYIYAVLHG